MRNWVNLFDGLVTPGGGEWSFSGIALSNDASRHLAKDVEGRPAILIRIAVGDGSPVAVSLENLRVDHDIACRVTNSEGDVDEGRFTIILCTSTEAALHEYFLCTMEGVISALPEPLHPEDIMVVIDNLVSLFQALRCASSRSVSGLWAELFLIIHANEQRVMLNAWHSIPADRYDFALGHERIEVKGACDGTRRHHFSYNQAYPPQALSVFVASLFVEASADGVSLGELWDQARNLASGDPDLLMRVEQVCLGALGSSWAEARQRRFNPQQAEGSLRFYDILEIPKVPVDIPQGVSEIRFRSDLGIVDAADFDELIERGPLFNTCLPP